MLNVKSSLFNIEENDLFCCRCDMRWITATTNVSFSRLFACAVLVWVESPSPTERCDAISKTDTLYIGRYKISEDPKFIPAVAVAVYINNKKRFGPAKIMTMDKEGNEEVSSVDNYEVYVLTALTIALKCR